MVFGLIMAVAFVSMGAGFVAYCYPTLDPPKMKVAQFIVAAGPIGIAAGLFLVAWVK